MCGSRVIRLSGFFLAAVLSGAHADTFYKCADSEGLITFTNQKTAGKQCVVLSKTATSAPKASSASTRVTQPTPSGFPKVSDVQQRTRDTDRRTILEEELASERKKLETLVPIVPESQEARRHHEHNIEALKKELEKLRK